ncbi:MAG: DUF2784 domain-containing protein [Acidobacteriota bacterium]|nr:DUF2784 domain-containing protein [Acidobacteriota bacterium]
MIFQALADLVVLVHLAFAAFAVAGGLFVLRWRRAAWVHVPAAIWGAAVEFGGWICPLTHLENWLRLRAGAAAYAGDFVTHYLVPVLYPANLTRTVQIVLGSVVVLVNVGMYLYAWRRDVGFGIRD